MPSPKLQKMPNPNMPRCTNPDGHKWKEVDKEEFKEAYQTLKEMNPPKAILDMVPAHALGTIRIESKIFECEYCDCYKMVPKDES